MFYLILFLLLVFGLPLFSALGGLNLLLMLQELAGDISWEDGLLGLFLDPYREITRSEMLLPIPFFALSGFLLARAKTAERLFGLFCLIFSRRGQVKGFLTGGFALFALFIFTPMTGASGVTIIALGGLLFPLLTKAGYSEKQALGLITAGGSLGLLLFPSLPVILYGILSMNKTSVRELFLAGLAPSMLVLVSLLAFNFMAYRSAKVNLENEPFNFQEATKLFLELLIIPLIFFLFQKGKITPVEMSVIFLSYFFLLEVFVFKELGLSDLLGIVEQAGSLVGGIFLIIFFAMGLTKTLIYMEVPQKLFSFFSQFVQNKWQFLLLLNSLLIAAGMIMDIFSAIVVLSPLVIHLGEAYGVDMIHLGIVFLTNLEIGYLTPPVGINLFISSMRFKKSLPYVYRTVWPYVILLILCQLLITYIPAISLWYR
ncbi:MAG: TRAP transporter large permease [Leptospiraceae bacterium]|nr:TRAP transporter large permease [Leptospiraceae bacterium]MDW8306490.1 TRAP transporter large permease [Leptospiraceae bacterium]